MSGFFTKKSEHKILIFYRSVADIDELWGLGKAGRNVWHSNLTATLSHQSQLWQTDFAVSYPCRCLPQALPGLRHIHKLHLVEHLSFILRVAIKDKKIFRHHCACHQLLLTLMLEQLNTKSRTPCCTHRSTKGILSTLTNTSCDQRVLADISCKPFVTSNSSSSGAQVALVKISWHIDLPTKPCHQFVKHISHLAKLACLPQTLRHIHLPLHFLF